MADAGKNPLFRFKDQFKKAHEEHKNDVTDFSGGGELPAGIPRGVAQLVECRVQEMKSGNHKGKPCFYAAGIVQTPEEFDGIRCAGLRTQMIIPMCDTPERMTDKTFSDHLKKIYDKLRICGVDTTSINDDEGFLRTLDMLQQVKPYFYFHTWKPKPDAQNKNPRTQQVWDAPCTDFAPSTDQDQVDNSEEVDEDADEAPPPPPPPTRRGGKSPQPQLPPTSPKESAADFDEFSDLDSLLQRANAEDVKAQQALGELAREAGMDDDDFEAATWDQVVNFIKNASGGTEEAAVPTTEDAPAIGDQAVYHPWNPKTKGPSKRGVDVEVTLVNAKAGTVTVVAADGSGKAWNDVPWAELKTE